MDEFGEVLAEDTLGYASVHMALRAPRVAIRVPADENWRSMFALAMATAGQLWGGAGFIYLPFSTRDGSVHPAILRALRAYDPDYLIDMKLTIADMEALQPGWLAARTHDVEAGTARYEQLLETSGDMDVRLGGDAIGAAVCSPYYDHFDAEDKTPRSVSLEGTDYGGPLASRAAVTGNNQQPAFTIPDGLDPDLCLALGMRAGFGSKPRLPLGTPAAESTDHDPLPKDYVRYALTVDRSQSYFGGELLGLSTAWQLSAAGLVPVASVRRRSPAIAVIGSTPEDFALAVALDRMFGQATWLPTEWLDNPDLESAVQAAWWNFRQARHRSGDAPVVTSISIDTEELSRRLHARWPLPEVTIRSGNEQMVLPEPAATSVDPSSLELESPRHLACAGDYDLTTTTLPTRADGSGGFELLQDLPIQTPSSPALQTAARPFWEIDVTIADHPLPPSRDVSGQAFVSAQRRFAPSLPRSSRDGISFNSMSMDFVPSGATLRQSTASLRLRMPSLRTWVEAMVSRHEPEYLSRPSDAGRRAITCARLWGSRSALADDLARLDGFLRAFSPRSRQTSVAYPEGDGFIVPGIGGLLTAAATARALPDFDPAQVRSCLDRLLALKVLRRGLVLRCSACERWDFYDLGTAAETNVCRRCGAYAHTTDAWRALDVGEPAWFYDLHGAVRELLQQAGDVPLLAARTLAASARRFADVPELDFERSDSKPQEIDLICLVDDRLIVGEAKIKAELGSGSKRRSSIIKLVRVANLLAADEIVLCTTAPAPWKQEDIDLLHAEMKASRWRTGVTPAVRVLTDLRADKPSNVVHIPSKNSMRK